MNHALARFFKNIVVNNESVFKKVKISFPLHALFRSVSEQATSALC